MRSLAAPTQAFASIALTKKLVAARKRRAQEAEVRAREAKEVELYNEFADDMKTVGFAWGPDFKSGFTSEPIEIVDIYQIMAFLLKIPPNYHDGQWSR